MLWRPNRKVRTGVPANVWASQQAAHSLPGGIDGAHRQTRIRLRPEGVAEPDVDATLASVSSVAEEDEQRQKAGHAMLLRQAAGAGKSRGPAPNSEHPMPQGRVANGENPELTILPSRSGGRQDAGHAMVRRQAPNAKTLGNRCRDVRRLTMQRHAANAEAPGAQCYDVTRPALEGQAPDQLDHARVAWEHATRVVEQRAAGDHVRSNGVRHRGEADIVDVARGVLRMVEQVE